MNATNKRIVVCVWTVYWLCALFAGPLSAQTTHGTDIAVVVHADTSITDFASSAQTTHGTDIAVVVHADTPVSDLSLAEVRRVLLGERQYWNAKLPVVLLIRAPVARERDVVLRVIYQMSETEFKQYWVAKIFRAEAASPPKIVYSNDMQLDLVAALPGAIAFVDSRNVRAGMKVIRVDGKMPGDKDYALR